MVLIKNKNDFKEMPWKNGGGITSEIFLIPGPESFLFRLSRAQVSASGPFSLFPNIDRILFLLQGHGMELNSSSQRITLDKKLNPFYFKGEEPFSCELINGPCIDFNVMTDRNYAKAQISVTSLTSNEVINLKAECDLKFIYDIDNEILYHLTIGETYSAELKTYITIDLEIL